MEKVLAYCKQAFCFFKNYKYKVYTKKYTEPIVLLNKLPLW